MRQGVGFLLVAAVLWGTTFPATRYGLEAGALPPYAFLYYRFVVATLVLLAFAAWRRRIQLSLLRDPRIIVLALVNTLGYVLQYVAQDLTTASKTALLVNVNVLVTAVLAWWLLRERVAATTGWGVATGAVGVYLIATGGDASLLRFSNAEFVGDVLAFGTGLCWTAYILVAKRWLDARKELDLIAVTAAVFVLTTILLFPIAWWADGLAFTGTAHGVAAVLYLGLFPTVLAFWLYLEGLRRTPASVSAILLLFEIVVAVGLSVWLLGERLTLAKWVGAGLILGATYLASRVPPRVAPTPGPEAAPGS